MSLIGLMDVSPIQAEGNEMRKEGVDTHGIKNNILQRGFMILVSKFSKITNRLQRKVEGADTSGLSQCIYDPMVSDGRTQSREYRTRVQKTGNKKSVN